MSSGETCSVIYSLPLLLSGTKSLTPHAGSFTEFPAYAMFLGDKQLSLRCLHPCYPPNILRHHGLCTPSCAPPASGRGSPLPCCSSAGLSASRVSVGASMAGILLVSWATTVSCRRRSSVRASRSASSCSRRYRIWSCSEAMSSDWPPGTPPTYHRPIGRTPSLSLS
jgi:hypothetical protein